MKQGQESPFSFALPSERSVAGAFLPTRTRLRQGYGGQASALPGGRSSKVGRFWGVLSQGSGFTFQLSDEFLFGGEVEFVAAGEDLI